jgi:2-dehydro-3-deoxygluconokinase
VSRANKRVALIGECLVELNGTPFGSLNQTFGGDSLNTAVYLARLAGRMMDIHYVSVLGTDALSDGMIQRWQAEGIDTSLVLRDSDHLPGLYLIQVDAGGERTFLYWRGESAARYLMRLSGFSRIATELGRMDWIYLSGISLAILPAEDRAKLLELLVQLAARGVALAFDSNYRAALWASRDAARAATTALLPAAKLLLVTFDDEHRLWGDDTPDATLTRLKASKVESIIIKLGPEGCLCWHDNTVTKVRTSSVANVVDTTAAGDAFNAGFLAGWLTDRSPHECGGIGNTLAGVVIQHQGAIIPAAAMPSFSEWLNARNPDLA